MKINTASKFAINFRYEFPTLQLDEIQQKITQNRKHEVLDNSRKRKQIVIEFEKRELGVI